ncbi:MAG: S1 family peptidase [Gordonia sp. (in: high G+C Gram-positive bacteria)]|uniref:S1 family peptidase n=1 Tax=Gordonia sp. (in: high G+C Gram-positive bacteria) TaxID=84139 RepID=UPI0039E59079
MIDLRRALAALIVVLTALVPMHLAAGHADAAPRATVGGGSAIVLGGKYTCTMTTVGRDRGGRLLGLTAAHCTQGGSYTVALRNNRSAGVIGRVSALNRNSDIALVTLNPTRVRPVRSVGRARIDGVGRFPGFGADVCKLGATTGFTCGPVLQGGRSVSTGYVCAAPGDSGAPVLHGGRVVGMLNGGQEVGGKAYPCPGGGSLLFSPMVATDMTGLLASLNRYGRVGAGFRPI